jgi:hypothetical protein
MLLKRRPPKIDTTRPFEPKPGFEHVDAGEIALLRWLNEHSIDFVVVGSVDVDRTVHTGSVTAGPLAIVPAPYRRNLERLARALAGAEARVRNESARPPGRDRDAPVQLTVTDLMEDRVWPLCCGPLPIDVVGTTAPSTGGAHGSSDYQELLYEATRVELTSDLSVEIASPEDIGHYAHLRSTGSPPEITISRGLTTAENGEGAEPPPTTETQEDGSGQASTGAPHPDSPPGSE